jgi:hypothetical protein
VCTHQQYIVGFTMTGAFAHGAIFFIKDLLERHFLHKPSPFFLSKINFEKKRFSYIKIYFR